MRKAYADAQASWQRIVRQQEYYHAEAEQWYQRAQLALRRGGGSEDLARQALLRRAALMEQARALPVEQQRQLLDKMETALETLQERIQQASAQRNQLVARAKTAKATQKVNDMLSGLMSSIGNNKGATAAFARMQEKVEAMEAAAEASSQWVESSTGKFSDDAMEKEFQLFEASSQIEQELQAMKERMALPASLSATEKWVEKDGAVMNNIWSPGAKSVVRIPVQ